MEIRLIAPETAFCPNTSHAQPFGTPLKDGQCRSHKYPAVLFFFFFAQEPDTRGCDRRRRADFTQEWRKRFWHVRKPLLRRRLLLLLQGKLGWLLSSCRTAAVRRYGSGGSGLPFCTALSPCRLGARSASCRAATSGISFPERWWGKKHRCCREVSHPCSLINFLASY